MYFAIDFKWCVLLNFELKMVNNFSNRLIAKLTVVFIKRSFDVDRAVMGLGVCQGQLANPVDDAI